ncbi:UNVERIFIED_CONTAM: hypothetical protein RMT77_008130 [Armadillidium vulgare]
MDDIRERLQEIQMRKEKLEDRRKFLTDMKQSLPTISYHDAVTRNQRWIKEMEVVMSKMRCDISQPLTEELLSRKQAYLEL